MGIYDRDYERSYDTGSGWRDGGGGSGGGFSAWPANTKLLVALVTVYVAQVVTLSSPPGAERLPPEKALPQTSWITETLALPSDLLQQPWRVYSLLTYGFVHDTVAIGHLLFNGIALFFFGRAINQRYGGREYFAIFAGAVMTGGVAWWLTTLPTLGQIPDGVRPPILLGASGGIAGVLVLFALHYPKAQILIWGVLPAPAWAVVGVGMLFDVFGFFGGGRGNVAVSAHLGGALFGYLYFRNEWRLASWVPTPDSLKLPSLKRRPKLRVHVADDGDAAEEPEDDRLDRILEKIQRSGQASLSKDERRYLEQASRRAQRRRRG